MITQILASYSRRYHGRWHRGVIRGYRRIKAEGRLPWVAEVKHELASTSVERGPEGSALLFGPAASTSERVVRQYLVASLDNLKFVEALLFAISQPNGKLAFPLPPSWRRAAESAGVPIAHFRCACLWILFCVVMAANGFLSLFRHAAYAYADRNARPLQGAAYFEGLGNGQLPQQDSGKSYDIFSWYAGWTGRPAEVKGLAHSVAAGDQLSAGGLPLRQSRSGVPHPATVVGILKLLRDGAHASVLAAFDICRGRWRSAIMLREAIKMLAVRHAPGSNIPLDILFHNSGWLYRPLWTYEAEARGSRVLFYFYSTNCEVFKRPGGYPFQFGHWELCTWATWLVWDEDQAQFVRRAVGNADIRIVGPIWFSDGGARGWQMPEVQVAVFDVQPMRESIYCGLGQPLEYYVPEVACAFGLDIAEACRALGQPVAFKRKRDVGKRAHPAYAKMRLDAIARDLLHDVPPSLAPQHIIERASCVVSMPFTSTALIAREMGKPSCFYDPAGVIQRDDRAAHSIEILLSPIELENWIRQYTVNSNSVRGSA